MGKVLITGATGFIGNHVTRLCLERGDEVRVMVMPREDRSPLQGMDVEIVEGNLLDPHSLSRAVQGVQQLYHLAALFAIWTKDPDLHFKINVDGARYMMELAKAAGVEKIVFTSSVAAIGIVGDGGWATEKTPFNGWPWASEYILSKFISHQMVKGMVSDGLHHDVADGGGLHGAGSHREAGRVGEGLVEKIVAAAPADDVDAPHLLRRDLHQVIDDLGAPQGQRFENEAGKADRRARNP